MEPAWQLTQGSNSSGSAQLDWQRQKAVEPFGKLGGGDNVGVAEGAELYVGLMELRQQREARDAAVPT